MPEEEFVTHKFASIFEFYQKEGSFSSTAKGNSQITRGNPSEATCVNKTFHLMSHYPFPVVAFRKISAARSSRDFKSPQRQEVSCFAQKVGATRAYSGKKFLKLLLYIFYHPMYFLCSFDHPIAFFGGIISHMHH
jgi:hypothetical protein